MDKYKSKTQKIEAIRITRDVFSGKNIPDIFMKAGNLWNFHRSRFMVKNRKGYNWGEAGDWLVKDSDGEFYIFSNREFKKEYEKIDA